MIRVALILILLFPGVLNAQFFARHPNGTATGQGSFVRDVSRNVPQMGLSDLTLAPDGRLFTISDTSRIFELDDLGTIIRTISYVGSIVPYSITGSDCEAIAWVNGDALSDTFAILHENSRVVFFVDIPLVGDYTIDLAAVSALIQIPGVGAPYESLRRDPFDPTRLISCRTGPVKSTTLAPYEVDLYHDGESPQFSVTDSVFVKSTASYYQTIRSTFHPPELVNSLAVHRLGNGSIRLLERAANGNHVSFQQIETLGTYVEGIAAKRTPADDGWMIFVCIDVNSATANNFFRYVRMD